MFYDEKIKHENNYFMGSKAFEVMKNMSKGDIKRFLELTKNDEDPEYPYIKEYRWFLKKCYEEKKEGVKYPSTNSPKNLKEQYNLTIDLWNLKESEWWFRQKYKLMKALKDKYKSAPFLAKESKTRSSSNMEIKHQVWFDLGDSEEKKKEDSFSFYNINISEPVFRGDNKVDREVSTGPDVGHMLSIIKS